jgi:hypothetical protein
VRDKALIRLQQLPSRETLHQLGIGVHLVQPNEFFAYKGTVAISWRNVRVAVIHSLARSRIAMRLIAPPG